MAVPARTGRAFQPLQIPLIFPFHLPESKKCPQSIIIAFPFSTLFPCSLLLMINIVGRVQRGGF
ncbi:hypothetical protein Pfo_008525 [Paulownia fortunei]|nr:hypothetical protein Pfo_008525 [Paulownia fortunei]